MSVRGWFGGREGRNWWMEWDENGRVIWLTKVIWLDFLARFFLFLGGIGINLLTLTLAWHDLTWHWHSSCLAVYFSFLCVSHEPRGAYSHPNVLRYALLCFPAATATRGSPLVVNRGRQCFAKIQASSILLPDPMVSSIESGAIAIQASARGYDVTVTRSKRGEKGTLQKGMAFA